MNKYKLYSIVVLLTMAMSRAWAGTTTVSLSASLPVEDNGDWVVAVSLDNPDDVVTSLQFDLSIPADFSYTAGNYSFSNRCTERKYGRDVDTHSVVSTSVEHGGTVRVILYSNDNKSIKGTSGEVVYFYLQGLGTANATPCNLTNIVAGTLDGEGNVNDEPQYPQAEIGDPELPCYDTMDNDVLVIGSLSEVQLEEVNQCLRTNANVTMIDLSRCTNEELGALDVQNAAAMIICNHKGQVTNTENVVYREGDSWRAEQLSIDDAQKSFELPKDMTIDNFQYQRNFRNTSWQALFLPVALPVEQLRNNFDLARMSSAEQVGDELRLKASTTMPEYLEPNTPYLIRAHETGLQTIAATHVTAKVTEERTQTFDTEDFSVMFTGTYARKTDMFQSEAYALSGGVLAKPTSASVTLGCFRWFMTVSGTRNVKICSLMWDDMETAVEDIEGEMVNGKWSNGEWYDLSGRRVKTMIGNASADGGVSRGVYIDANGKKVCK